MTDTIAAIPDVALSCAAAVLARKDYGLRSVLDAVPQPLYVTDDKGLVVFANPACEDFAGRAPQAGKDRWCVSWKLYTRDGEPLPHEACPMAETIKTRAAVRGVAATAERPDGTRVSFIPLPTPIFGRGGKLIGAVNMLLAVA